MDPQAAHLGARIRLVREKRPEGLEQEEGGAREGLARRTLAAAEHACSTPKSKWSAEREEHAQSTDAPEGVVGENKVELRVQPFSCSGPSDNEGFDESSAWKSTPKEVRMRHLMRAQLG